MARAKTITAKAREISSKPLDTPGAPVLAKGVSPDLLALTRYIAQGEAFREFAELHLELRVLDDEIRRSRHARDGANDETTNAAKGLLLAGLEGERAALEKQIRRLIDRHFPLGMVV